MYDEKPRRDDGVDEPPAVVRAVLIWLGASVLAVVVVVLCLLTMGVYR